MRAICDRNICQGHGRCQALAPDVFQLDANGYIAKDEFLVPMGQEERARVAAGSCPEEVIRLVDD